MRMVCPGAASIGPHSASSSCIRALKRSADRVTAAWMFPGRVQPPVSSRSRSSRVISAAARAGRDTGRPSSAATDVAMAATSGEELEGMYAGSLARAVAGDVENGSVMAGQVAALVTERGTAAEVIANMVREAEALCKRMSRKPPRKKELLRPALPTEVELSLAERLGTEVKVRYQDGRGSLQIHFYSDDQLRAFANLLGEYQTGKL